MYNSYALAAVQSLALLGSDRFSKNSTWYEIKRNWEKWVKGREKVGGKKTRKEN